MELVGWLVSALLISRDLFVFILRKLIPRLETNAKRKLCVWKIYVRYLRLQ
jgi:hypothetical protein